VADELLTWAKQFTRPVRGRPEHRLLDGFDHEFCLLFDFSEDPETPASKNTCDIRLAPLPTTDVLADAIQLVSNANKHGVMRLLAALGISRFDDRVKKAFYALGSVLREG
jgi:hypothetical protein